MDNLLMVKLRLLKQAFSATGLHKMDEVVDEGFVTFQNAEFSGNLAASYDNGFVDSRLALSYFGDAFVNDGNSVVLDGHTIATLSAEYTPSYKPFSKIRILS